MTAPDLLANFLQQHRRPYSLDSLADFTGIELPALLPLHDAALASGDTREVEPGIFISACAHRGAATPVKYGSQVWKFDVMVAQQILHALETDTWRSSRALAKHLGVSHQFIAVYLTALMSISVVGVSSEGYEVIDRDNLPRLGEEYHPGIIMQKRRAAGLKSRRKKRWPHVPDYQP